jgi:LacI family transcriptional regulator
MSETASGNGRPVKLRDVARLAGVDVSTASRALTGQRKVAADTLERVTSAAATLGYTPNQAARNLRLSRTMTLGVVINRFDSPIYLDALEGMGATCHTHGYELMITSARNDPSLYALLAQRLFERRVDGLILWNPPPIREPLAPILALDLPVLAIGVRGKDSPAVPYVNVTEDQPIHEAVQRLAALGHRALFYVRVPFDYGRPRLPSLEREAAHAGIRLEHEAFASDRTMPELCALLRRYLDPPHRATAILSDHRHVARVTAALHLLRVRVPEDVSLLGFARSRWAQETWLETATIQTDAVRFGNAVARLMIEWLGGTRPPDVTEVDVAEWVEHRTVGAATSV